MTLTSAPIGLFRFTPTDGAIDVFEIGRAPKFANVQEHDLGQTVARSEGTKVYVFGKSVEVNTYRFSFDGLTTHEFEYLRLYIQDKAVGSLKPGTVEWGRARNRIAYSTDVSARDSENFEGWAFSGAGSPSANDENVAGPEGFAGTASEITFGGSAGASVVWVDSIFADFGAGVGYTTFSFLAKVTDSGGAFIMTAGTAGADVSMTVPDDGAWHEFSGNYTGGSNTHFRFVNTTSGTRRIGLTKVMVAWNLSHALAADFYDPVPFHTISNARYIPGSFQGTQKQNDMWSCDLLFRQEIP